MNWEAMPKYYRWYRRCKAEFWGLTGLEIMELKPRPDFAGGYNRGEDPEAFARQLVSNLLGLWDDRLREEVEGWR